MTDSAPLENAKHEQFAQAMANGAPKGETYSSIFGTKGATSSVNANRMLKNAKILARIANLKAQSAEKCEITRDELLGIMVQTLRAKPHEASMNNPLCELKMSKEGPYPIFIDKSKAAERICKMLGWDAAEKIEHSGEIVLPPIQFKVPAHFIQRRGQHASSN